MLSVFEFAHVDWAQEALWSPQGCDAACKPDHLGCRSSRPARYGEQAMFNSSQNALIFLKHLPFKLKEKWRNFISPSYQPAKQLTPCGSANIWGVGNEMEKKLQVAVPMLLQVKMLLPVAGFVCAIQPGLFHCQNPAPAWLCPAPVWPLLFPVCIRVGDTALNAWGFVTAIPAVARPLQHWFFFISVASLLWHIRPVPAAWERMTW